MKPTTINVVGIEYSVLYFDNPAEVSRDKRESLWGEIDYWTRTIRIYDNGRPLEDVWHSIIHEVLHGIASELHLTMLQGETNHDDLDVLALALTDVLFRNNWIVRE